MDPVGLTRLKAEGTKITMLTAYDHPTARLLDEAGIDVLLVGDSAANVVLGYPDTLPITMDEMIVITRAVSRAARRAMVIGDMPFMSFQRSVGDAIENAGRFVQQGGAQGVKLEGGGSVVDTVRAIVDAGIPVCGHLGLLPQSASMLGGYRVQGLEAAQARRILEDARRLEDAGAFLLVVECIPERLGSLLSRSLSIPVIGIGAGAGCDGQVLVLHDILGIKAGFTPRFVKRFAEVGEEISRAARAFRREVLDGAFPGPEHVFRMDDEQYEKIE
jgi:3-methyl-2-oxobutanoate hydroxymethyltransferase